MEAHLVDSSDEESEEGLQDRPEEASASDIAEKMLLCAYATHVETLGVLIRPLQLAMGCAVGVLHYHATQRLGGRPHAHR